MTGQNFADDLVLSVDPNEVVYDTVDGETVVVALATGTYYTITGAGVDMWSAASAGVRFGDAVIFLQGRYPSERETMRSVLARWLDELVAEGLVHTGPGNGAEISDDLAPTDRTTYEAPVLVRYTDLQSLILLDPIHEADVHTGWPNRR